MLDTFCVSHSQDVYRDQLARLARAMASTQWDEVTHKLSADSDATGVQLFVEGNWEKRCDKLANQLEFVAAAFDDFPQLIQAYVDTAPSPAYDTSLSDGERMLVWLRNTRRLTAEQADRIACQQARHAVEERAREQRLAHVRFQERYSLVEKWLANFDAASPLRLYLNPIRTWTKFISPALLDESASPPAHVLFFACGGEISSAVLELEGQALVNELADYQPCTLAEWAAVSSAGDTAALTAMVRDLATMGLVALG